MALGAPYQRIADAKRIWNVSKVLHLPFWRELVKYVCVLGIVEYVNGYIGFVKMLTSCFPVWDDDPNSPMPIKPSDRATCQALDHC
eukprot:gene6862-7076_t